MNILISIQQPVRAWQIPAACVDTLRDHRIHDLNLPGVIGFIIRPIPQDLDTGILRGLVHAGADGDKKQV